MNSEKIYKIRELMELNKINFRNKASKMSKILEKSIKKITSKVSSDIKVDITYTKYDSYLPCINIYVGESCIELRYEFIIDNIMKYKYPDLTTQEDVDELIVLGVLAYEIYNKTNLYNQIYNYFEELKVISEKIVNNLNDIKREKEHIIEVSDKIIKENIIPDNIFILSNDIIISGKRYCGKNSKDGIQVLILKVVDNNCHIILTGRMKYTKYDYTNVNTYSLVVKFNRLAKLIKYKLNPNHNQEFRKLLNRELKIELLLE